FETDQREIEHPFSLEAYKRFRGLMATYLILFTKARYAGSSLRDRVRILPKPLQTVQTPAAWDLYSFTSACTSAAGESHLDAPSKGLANRLLVAADEKGVPVELLTQPTENSTHIEWPPSHAPT